MSQYDHYEESTFRARPSRRNTRPRTKERPQHRDAEEGMVTGVDRGRFTVIVDGHPVQAMRARELARGAVVVGDRVGLVGDTTGDDGALARIVRVAERRSVLRRSADDSDRIERVIVANADLMGIVTALADPEPRHRMVDRCLVAAYDAGMEPLLVLTKSDLADPGPFLAGYAALQVAYVVTSVDLDGSSPRGMEDLVGHLQGRVSVLVGHSGVGKSTLVNLLVPEALRATGVVNAVTGRGRHTSTSAVALPLPSGGWVVDTPGVRSFGLGHVAPETFLQHFPDLSPGADGCPRGCSHDEPDCALDAWVGSGAAGAAGPDRLESLRRLLRSRAGTD